MLQYECRLASCTDGQGIASLELPMLQDKNGWDRDAFREAILWVWEG